MKAKSNASFYPGIRLFQVLLLVCGIPFVGPAQCPEGNVVLTSQEEVDQFIVEYPNCSQIMGNLTIAESDSGDIIDLTSLNNIEKVNGYFHITNNTSLKNFAGLETVKRIGGDFKVESNDDLITFEGLNVLDTIGGRLQIVSNTVLENIEDLASLTHIEYSIDIYSNVRLKSLSGLHNLTEIYSLDIINNHSLKDLRGIGDRDTIFFIDITQNKSLSSLSGLDSLVHSEYLDIIENINLTDISALAKLRSGGGRIEISYNNNLPNLAGLDSLNYVAGDLIINNNDSLVHIENLKGLRMVGVDLEIEDNPALVSLQGLENLDSVRNLRISNAGIENLVGLEGLHRLDILSVNDNSSLTNLSGLDSLDEIGFGLSISGNDSLVNLEGLNALTMIGASGFYLSSNYVLKDLAGLRNLKTVEGPFQITDSYNLINLNGLDSLKKVGGNLWISSNGLEEINSLINLDTVAGEIIIRNNRSLKNISGLTNIVPEPVAQWTIENSDALTDCAIRSLCTYLDLDGTIQLSDNGTGCNTEGEIESACAALPLVLTGFEAVKEGEKVLLQWTSPDNWHGQYFTVEHSTDGYRWSGLESIRIDPGKERYHFLHEAPADGRNYYRLRQVDRDGSEYFSNVLSVVFSKGNEVILYPNPAWNYFTIKNQSPGSPVIITDTMGRTISKKRSVNSQERIDMTGVPKGIYFVRVESNRRAVNFKLVLDGR